MKLVACCILAGTLGILLTGCGSDIAGKTADEVKTGNQVMGVSVHDPSILKADGKYYIFGSHMEAAESEDLISFKSFASGVNGANPLFKNLFSKDMDAFSFVGKYVEGGYAVWAPDVIYNPVMKKWVMYFSVSHDYMTSNICFATADQAKGPYTYQQKILFSGYTMNNVDKTNFHEILGADAKVSSYMSGGKYNNLNYPNCIDPTVFLDSEQRMWMVYGSWSGGIWLLELDQKTGLPIHPVADKSQHIDQYYGKYLIGGLHNSCEGPYIMYDKNSGYYYLFVSYGRLTREGGYQIRLFRSKTVDGKYVDASGNTLGYESDHSPYGLKMMGNYSFPSLKTAYMAPGHNSAFIDDDGSMYLVYHQRFDNKSEYHEPRVHQMFTTEDGWLVAAPFPVNSKKTERLTDFSLKDLAGNYYLVNHQTDISAEIHAAQKTVIKQDGTVTFADGSKGSLKLGDQSGYLSITVGKVVYQGVVADMVDEAGNPVRCIMAVGNNNETLWAVLYQ